MSDCHGVGLTGQAILDTHGDVVGHSLLEFGHIRVAARSKADHATELVSQRLCTAERWSQRVFDGLLQFVPRLERTAPPLAAASLLPIYGAPVARYGANDHRRWPDVNLTDAGWTHLGATALGEGRVEPTLAGISVRGGYVRNQKVHFRGGLVSVRCARRAPPRRAPAPAR